MMAMELRILNTVYMEKRLGKYRLTKYCIIVSLNFGQRTKDEIGRLKL